MARIDLYRNVHKGQRAHLFDLAVELGRIDWSDPALSTALVGRLSGAIAELRKHADNEERFIHPLLRARAPETAAALERQHLATEAMLSELEERLHLPEGVTEERAAAGAELYRAWCRMVSAYLAHLDAEESLAMPALWAACSDSEIFAVVGTFLASRSLAEQLDDLRGQVPVLTPQERIAFVGNVMRGGALPADRIWDSLAGVLPPGGLARLRAGLGAT